MRPADQMHINTGDLNSLKYWGLEVTQKLKIIIHISKYWGREFIKILGIKIQTIKIIIGINGKASKMWMVNLKVYSGQVWKYYSWKCKADLIRKCWQLWQGSLPFVQLGRFVWKPKYRTVDSGHLTRLALIWVSLGWKSITNKKQSNNWNWYEIQIRSLDQYDLKLCMLL